MTSSLRSRIRDGTLLLLALVLVLGAYTLPRVNSLGGAIRETPFNNYASIDVGQHMHADLRTLELAERDRKGQEVVAGTRSDFMHWIDIEHYDVTKVGAPQLANDIERRTNQLFAEISSLRQTGHHDKEFQEHHPRVDDLIALNKGAMFRAHKPSVLWAHCSFYRTLPTFGIRIARALTWLQPYRMRFAPIDLVGVVSRPSSA